MENLGVSPEFWRGRRVLLTGQTGFKGAWLALWLDMLGAKVTAFALPAEPESLWPRFSPPLAMPSRAIDVRDSAAVADAVREAAPEIVLHLAAQAIVRRGYNTPADTFATNVTGTINLIEALRSSDKLRALLVITSDKVYAGAPGERGYLESDALGGIDPYSASKAACEIVVGTYREAYFQPKSVTVATARAGNVIGGGDMGEDRLLPDIVRAMRTDGRLRLRASGALRPWLHVLDATSGYLTFTEHMFHHPERSPSALNFGPNESSRRSVRELVDATCAAWGKSLSIESNTATPVEPKPLWLDSTAARQTLGWKPRLEFEQTVQWTADWWRRLEQGHTARTICADQIDAYTRLLR